MYISSAHFLIPHSATLFTQAKNLMSHPLTEKIATLKANFEPTLVAILMAEHPRLGMNSTIPTDVVPIIAKLVHQDVSIYLIKYRIFLFEKPQNSR